MSHYVSADPRVMFRFYVDPETDASNNCNHSVRKSLVAIGSMRRGRRRRAVHAPDPEPNSPYAFTACWLHCKPAFAYPRRRRKMYP